MTLPRMRFSQPALLTILSLFLFTHSVVGRAGVVQSSEGRSGNILFQTPDGWRSVEKDGAVLLVPPDLPAGQACVLIVLPGQEARGDFRALFDAKRHELQQGEKVLGTTEVVAERAAGGFETLSTVTATQDRSGTSTFRFYLAAHPGTRFEMLAYAATSEELFRRYQPAVLEFVKHLSFANLSSREAASPRRADAGARHAAPPERASSAGGLEGLYVGTESRQQFNVNTKFYDYIVQQVYYLFLPDGEVYYGLPKGGQLDDFDFARARRTDPGNCGFYRLAGGQIQFTWPRTGAAPPLAFSRSGDGLQLGRTSYFRVRPAEGSRLEGVYARRSFANLSGGAGIASGGVGGETSIAFSPDGRFREQNFVGFTGSNAGFGAANSGQGQGGGTYRISGHTLELDYANGRSQRFTFFIYPQERNVIVIDGTPFLRRDR